jgi:Fe-S cluster assembly scaffold protein SufB
MSPFCSTVGQKTQNVFLETVTDGDPHKEINLSLKEGESLTCVLLNTAQQPSRIVQRGSIPTSASLHWIVISLGRSVEHTLISNVTGEGGASTIDIACFAKGNTVQTLDVQNIFCAPCGKGEMTIKGIAKDNATLNCTGCIDIRSHGRGTDTYLTQEMLMLDATATVHAIPKLEVQTNDVRASHSATVSKITDEDLFYFGSRGLNKSISRILFCEGFLGEVLTKIKDEKIREIVIKGFTKSNNLPHHYLRETHTGRRQ